MSVLSMAETFGVTPSEVFEMGHEEFIIAQEMLAARAQRREAERKGGGV